MNMLFKIGSTMAMVGISFMLIELIVDLWKMK